MESEKKSADSQVLVDRLVKNDESAAEEVFRRYVRRLTALARARLAPRVGRRVDPEDAVQSAFRSFFVGARSGRFTIECSGDLWRLLATITARKVSRLTRLHRGAKRSVTRESFDRTDEAQDVDFLADRLPSPDDAAALADELTELMRTLPPDQRRTLSLRLIDAPIADIARELACTERTVRRWLHGIEAQLVRRLGGPALERRAMPDSTTEASQPDFQAEAAVAATAAGLISVDYRDLVLQSHLGTGGMGRVYRAWQRSANRTVAVKVLKKSRQQETAAVERFIAEAKLIATLDHPNIIHLRGLGRMPAGGYFFTTELLEGGDLQQRIDEGSLASSQIADWLRQAADAVAHAHARGIIHCDLKPSNLLLDRDDRVVVSDFGFAVALAGNRLPLGGTRAFMAPELLDDRRGAVSERTDVWGLGAVLYALLFGVAPLHRAARRADFNGSTPSQPLEEICRLCLEVDPDDRYPNVLAIRSALAAAI